MTNKVQNDVNQQIDEWGMIVATIVAIIGGLYLIATTVGPQFLKMIFS